MREKKKRTNKSIEITMDKNDPFRHRAFHGFKIMEN